MSTTTQRFLSDVTQLSAALEEGRPYLEPQIIEDVEQILASARQRIELGVDHTVVALAGGTGSGKSSTFNAISGLDFADVGVRRPTTARVASCTWSSDAKALLDWIGVDLDRRISRDTALDGDEQKALNGLILLDLPDHDSVALQHREIVDKVLPLVDVLVWIIDPQKYADEALHAQYLQKMVDAKASMVVVLNQMDTVGSAQRDILIQDVHKVLAHDGLDGVRVRPISARTKEGVDELKSDLQQAVARRTMASQRLTDELSKAARTIAEQAPASVVTDTKALVSGEADRYLVASGLPAVCDEVSERTALNRSIDGPPVVRAPNENAVAGLRNRWLDRATQEMQPRWAAAVRASAGSAGDLTRALEEAAASIPVPWGPVKGASVVPAVLLGALSLVCLVLSICGFTIAQFSVPLSAGILVAAVLLAGLSAWSVRRRRSVLRKAGRLRSAQLRDDAAATFSRTITDVLVAPVEHLMKSHDSVSASALKVLTRSS